jgi:uncharacterized protein (DUF2062 family)
MAVIFLAVLFKLNKVIALAAAHISIPPMIPIIVFASFELGGMLLGRKGSAVLSNFRNNFELAQVKADLSQYILGSITLGVILALIVGGIFYICLMLFRKDVDASQQIQESIVEPGSGDW